MKNYGEWLRDDCLRFERLLPGPIDRVWAWMAIGDKRREWLAGGGDATKAGNNIDFDFQHQNLTPHDEVYPQAYQSMENGISYKIEVRLCQPPHHMVWHWPAEDNMDVEIDIQLEPEGDHVRLTLIQRGEVSVDHLIGSLAGWHVHLDILLDKLNDRTPAPFWNTHEIRCADYRARLAIKD